MLLNQYNVKKSLTMKTNISKLIVLFSVFSFVLFAFKAPTSTNEYCNKNSKKKTKKELKPYNYGSMKVSSVFTSDEDDMVWEVNVPLFSGEEYRFVFNVEGIKDDVVIEIYDRPKDEKRRKLLYSSEAFGEEQDVYLFHPEKSQPLYVNYKVSKTENVKEGCIMMMMGYKFHN